MGKLECVRKACKITDWTFSEILKNFDKFQTERDIEKFILKKFKSKGAGYSYRSIVANNNAVIHAVPRDQKLARGFLVLDIGARFKGYCSDMTRTIFLGKANKKEKELYDLILKCQNACLKKVCAGANCRELDLFARKYLGRYKKYFRFALGHGVGWRVHTRPKINPNSADFLKEHDIIAIEPGINIETKNEGFGIRIEDTLLVKKNGFELLNKSPKKLIEIRDF